MVSTALMLWKFLTAFHFSGIGNGTWLIGTIKETALYSQSLPSRRSQYVFSVHIFLLHFLLKELRLVKIIVQSCNERT